MRKLSSIRTETARLLADVRSAFQLLTLVWAAIGILVILALVPTIIILWENV